MPLLRGRGRGDIGKEVELEGIVLELMEPEGMECVVIMVVMVDSTCVVLSSFVEEGNGTGISVEEGVGMSVEEGRIEVEVVGELVMLLLGAAVVSAELVLEPEVDE